MPLRRLLPPSFPQRLRLPSGVAELYRACEPRRPRVWIGTAVQKWDKGEAAAPARCALAPSAPKLPYSSRELPSPIAALLNYSRRATAPLVGYTWGLVGFPRIGCSRVGRHTRSSVGQRAYQRKELSAAAEVERLKSVALPCVLTTTLAKRAGDEVGRSCEPPPDKLEASHNRHAFLPSVQRLPNSTKGDAPRTRHLSHDKNLRASAHTTKAKSLRLHLPPLSSHHTQAKTNKSQEEHTKRKNG